MNPYHPDDTITVDEISDPLTGFSVPKARLTTIAREIAEATFKEQPRARIDAMILSDYEFWNYAQWKYARWSGGSPPADYEKVLYQFIRAEFCRLLYEEQEKENQATKSRGAAKKVLYAVQVRDKA